ncbi:UvrD-helicase domain-containing protein [Cellulosimicrobium cellulans]|uniref:UvrD-helicase domain-containing protein n=1 Tax=Cellulosimicrobium cellulans TaxID=1710 RepID=UPI003C495B5B
MYLVPFEELTVEQQRFASLPTSRHVAGIGAPGSGKTLVLVHRAIRLVESGVVDPKRIRIVTFTNALEEYIRAGLIQWGHSPDMVVSIDHLMSELYKGMTGKRSFSLPGALNDDERFHGQRDAVHALLRDEAEQAMFAMGHRYDVILADETQDISASDAEILTMLARHVTVMLDGRQQLYRRGAMPEEILAALGLRWETSTFLYNFRSSASVLTLAARVAESEQDRALLTGTIARVAEEIPSRRVLASDRDEENEHLIAAIAARTAAGRSCAVLLPRTRFAYGLANALTQRGFNIEGPRKIDMTSDAVKVLTYHGAKGLSFDSVFLPRLSESQLRQVAQHTRRGSLLFVGLTRATTYLFLSAIKGEEAKEWRLFDDVEEKYLSTFVSTDASATSGVQGPEAGTPETSGETPDDAIDDFLG